MSNEEDVTKLHLIDQTEEKQGLLSHFKERVKTFFGLPSTGRDPNVGVKVLHSAERDECLNQLGLHQDQLLVSDVYRVVQNLQTLPPDGELIVPLEMPERSIPPQVLYTFTYCMKIGGKWHLEPAEYKEGGCVYGKLTEMDVFCVTAELKPEYATVGPNGHKFVSEKDERIAIDFPEHAVEEETKLIIVTDIIDQQRFEEYKKKNEEFRCIVGFTNILIVSPSVELRADAKIRLPVDAEFEKGDCDVMFLHWNSDEDEGEDVGEDVKVVNAVTEGASTYTAPVTSFSRYACVAVKRNIPIEEISIAAKHAIGKLNLCVLLTFIDYDQHRGANYLLVDCVEFTKVDRAVELHRTDGMTEVKHSRSRDIELKDKTKIKVLLGGCIKLHDKSFTTNAFYFNRMSRTNKVIIHFTSKGKDGNVRYCWGHHDHKIYFPLESKRSVAKKSSSVKPGQMSRSYSYELSGATSLTFHGTPGHSPGAKMHPILTDKSLAAFGDILPHSEWRSVGLELNFSIDAITSIFDKAERMKSNPGLELLTEWRRGNTLRNPEELINDLIAAFAELKRNDIVGVLNSAREHSRPIRRSDLDCGSPSSIPQFGPEASSSFGPFFSSNEISGDSSSVSSGSIQPVSSVGTAVDSSETLKSEDTEMFKHEL
ncbi:ankyrin-1-like [Haliotis cracherodii]|uniref:ankyrin-1-like n=1 Tax=Haliotis cracherodii TaxID=6455 RepID=UPI0039EC48D6